MMKSENRIFWKLKADADYAILSLSKELVYKAYDAASMARELQAITAEEFNELNHQLIYDGLNHKPALPWR